jgi:acyl-CoA synthetase (AMP-forming)/AMP-acid ligase II
VVETLGALAKKTFQAYSARPALSDGHVTYTYNDWRKRSNQLAHALLAHGLQKGDRVAILMSNRLEHLQLDVAIALAGLIKVPLNYRLHPKEHEYVVQQSGAKLLIGEKNLTQPLEGQVPVIHVGEPFEKWIESFPETYPDVHVSEDDLFAIMYTSGTTGRPKGVMLSHRNFIAGALSLIIGCELTAGDVIGHVAPLTHGSNFLAQCALVLGLKQVVFNKFEPGDFLDAIEREKISTVFLVPTMVNLMLFDESISRRDLSSLKTINMAGSPIAEERVKLAIEMLGPKFVETFGQVEAPMTITMMPRHELAERPAACGIAGPFVEMKIVGEQGNELPSGEVGEVICKGSLVMKGYWNNPQATEETLKDGWLHTGDLGWVDQEGYLYLVDRKKDVIISGGVNIYPREVEEVLNLHEAVKETCVFGIPDPKWGESVCAHVVLKEGQSAVHESELIDLCKEHLASFKKPQKVVFVEELPKSAYGKILRREIREAYRGVKG